MSGWLQATQPINREIRSGLDILRARSREATQNDDYMRRFLQLVQINVVGHQGIVLQARSKDPDGKPDTLANNTIEEAWRDWGRIGSCDMTGRYSWRSFERQVIRSVAQDGEAFVYLHNTQNNVYGFGVKLFDPELIDTQLNKERDVSGSRIVMGIELNEHDRPTAYYIKETTGEVINHTRKYNRVEATNIIHFYLPEWIDGVRGLPWCSQSLFRMGMLAGYEEAELVAARVAAAKMGFFTANEGGEYIGDDVDADGNLIMDAEAGAFEKLPQGVGFETFDPQHPTTAFKDFVKANLRGVAAGLGLSYNSLANDLEDVNYSSLRQGAIDERSTWMMLQDWMIESFNDRIYRRWLKSSLDRGVLQVAGRPLKKERFLKYANVSWQGRRWQWIDPSKEITAHEKAIELGIKSRSDVIREQGRDPEDVWQEIAKENERMLELGVTQPVQAESIGNEHAEN